MYALDEATREVVYLNKLLLSFKIPVPSPVAIGQDNMAAITPTKRAKISIHTPNTSLYATCT
jgi:hypothetical protein